MKEIVTVFENEEAVRLLNYFISYKQMISKNASTPNQHGLTAESAVRIGVLSEPEELAIKKLP